MDKGSESRRPSHFGWLAEHHADPALLNVVVQGDALDEEVVEEFEEIAGAFARIRPALIDFLALRADHSALSKLPDHLCSQYEGNNLPLLEGGLLFLETHVAAERRLSAFLNSASAFRDRLLARLASNPGHKALVKSCIKDVYDQSFAYRLCYNLRKYAQHQSAPLHFIPLRGSASEGSKKLSFTVTLEFDRNRLFQTADKYQPSVEAELGQAEPKLPLLSLCDEYYRGLREVLLAYLKLSGSEIERAILYEDAVIAAGKVPNGATPIIFHGTPEAAHAEAKALGEDKPEWTTGLSFFPFDELKLVKILIAEALPSKSAA